MTSPLQVLIDKLNSEAAALERDLKQNVVKDALIEELEREEITHVDEQGHHWHRRRTYDEAETLALKRIEEMSDDELDAAHENEYDNWSANVDSWEDIDHTRGYIEGLGHAVTRAQEVIDYGIQAFDPNHLRFKTARWIVSHEDGREHDPAFFNLSDAQYAAAQLGEGWAVMDAGPAPAPFENTDETLHGLGDIDGGGSE